MREETIVDIVAEMRTRSREVKEAFGGRPDGVENMLDIWADRIEAAEKRAVVSKTETTIGNAAAERAAATVWELSPRERALQALIDKRLEGAGA